MKPIRTYAVSVDGYTDALYSARSPAKATAKAWRDFSAMFDVSFKDFLRRARTRRVPDPPGIGDRIMVAGLPATRCIGYGQYVYFMRDDSDTVLCSHPADVSPLPAQPAQP